MDVVLEDWTRDSAGQTYYVVEVSERPWHYVRSHYIGAGVFRLAHETLTRSAAQADYSLPEPPLAGDRATVETRWQGVSNPKAFAEACAEKSTELGLSGRIWVEDNVGGVVKAEIWGTPASIALIGELSVQGGLSVDRVMSVESLPIDDADAPSGSPINELGAVTISRG